MPAEASILRIDRPGTGGQKDDPRRPNDALEIVDGLFPQGVLCERGGFAVTGQAVTGSSCLRPWEEVIGAGVAEGVEPAPDLMYGGATTVTIATSVSRAQNLYLPSALDCDANSQGYRIMPGTFNGEVLILPLDGLSPIMTFAGNITRTAVYNIFVNTTADSRVVTSSGTFPSDIVGCYLYLGPGHGCRRITSRIDASTITVDVAWGHTLSDVGGRINEVGVLNLFAQIASSGKATKNGTGQTVTGTGTQWTSSPPGEFLVHDPGNTREGVDYIAPIGVDYGTPLLVVDVPGASTITVGGENSGGALTPPTWGASAVDYVIGRHMPGRVACVHKSTLYVAGFRPYPGRLYHSPPTWDSRTPENGEFSYDVEIGKAMMMAYTDIPDPFTTHEITGLMSLPSGNLAVLCSDATFVAWGQHPGLSVQKTSDYGNLTPESTLLAEGGAWMAGPEGVFEFRNQNSPSMISGDIERAWRHYADDQSNPAASIALGYFKGHLLCTILPTNGSANVRTFVWDIRNRVWCGTWNIGSMSGYYYSTIPRTSGSPFGTYSMAGPSRLIAGNGGTQAYDLSTTVVDHLDEIAETDNLGALKLVTAVDTAGDLSREREVKYLKTQHQMTGTGALAIDVTPGPDGVNAAGTLGATTGDEIASSVFFPDTDLSGAESTLGERTSRFDVTLERTGGTPTKVAIHEIEMLVKEYRHRG